MKIVVSDDPVAVWEDIEADLKKAYEAMYPGRPVEQEVGPQDMSLLQGETGRLFVALGPTGEIAGCGGWVWLRAQGYPGWQIPREFPERTVEIKRLFVRKEFRGIGLSKRIDYVRLTDAKAHGAVLAVGEAGAPQKASLGLRKATGYEPVLPFGNMIHNPESHFFGRWL